MPGDLFSGLLQGFGSVLLDRQKARAAANYDTQKSLATLYAAAIERGDIDPEVGIPMIADIISGSMQDTGLFSDSVFSRGKGKKKGGEQTVIMQALQDPEQLSGGLMGLYQGLKQVGAGAEATPGQPPAAQTGAAAGAAPQAGPTPPAPETAQAMPSVAAAPVGSPASMIPEPQTATSPTAPVAMSPAPQQQPSTEPTATPPVSPETPTAPKPWEQPETVVPPTRTLPPIVRHGVFTTREEKQRRADEELTHKQAVTETGTFKGQVQNAQDFARLRNIPFEEAWKELGYNLGARGAQSTRPIKVGTIKVGDKYYEQFMDPVTREVTTQEVASPSERSARTLTEFEAKTSELSTQLGLPPDADPITAWRDLPGPQRETVRQAVAMDKANQVSKETTARVEADIAANKGKPLTVEEARALQLRYGTTTGQAEEIAGIPLTPQGAEAAAATYAFEADAVKAEELFDKIWPRIDQPELRRGALALLQRDQNPDYVQLQSVLERMSLQLAVIVQGSRPSDTDRQAFQVGFPNTRADNWSLIQVPTSYDAGVRLIGAAKNIATSARTSLGIVSLAERQRRANPQTAPGRGVVPPQGGTQGGGRGAGAGSADAPMPNVIRGPGGGFVAVPPP